mgnify:CR=1 FL=1
MTRAYRYELPRLQGQLAAGEIIPMQKLHARSDEEAWKKAERMFGKGGILYLVVPRSVGFPSEADVHPGRTFDPQREYHAEK